VSTGSLTPAVVTGATVFPSGADPIARFHQRIDVELALGELERAVRRLGRHLEPTPIQRHPLRRRTRRSAWCSSDY
jgi:hypothetical protein